MGEALPDKWKKSNEVLNWSPPLKFSTEVLHRSSSLNGSTEQKQSETKKYKEHRETTKNWKSIFDVENLSVARYPTGFARISRSLAASEWLCALYTLVAVSSSENLYSPTSQQKKMHPYARIIFFPVIRKTWRKRKCYFWGIKPNVLRFERIRYGYRSDLGTFGWTPRKLASRFITNLIPKGARNLAVYTPLKV